MAKYLVVIVLILFSCASKHAAQEGRALVEDRAEYVSNKIYIISTKSPFYDSALKRAVLKFWKSSELLGFVTPSSAKKLKKKKGFSFIETFNNTFVREYSIVPNSTSRSYTYYPMLTIRFFLGGKREMYSSNFDFDYFERVIDSAAYRLPIIIKNCNDLLTGQMPAKKSSEIELLRKKTLILARESFNKVKIRGKLVNAVDEDIFQNYPFKYEIASKEKISRLINEQDGNYLFAFPISNPTEGSLAIVDLEDFRRVCSIEKSWRNKFPVDKKDLTELISKLKE
jgi:hypothetical protein